MVKQHRISAAAIIIKDSKILLVRYKNRRGKTYLVGPGGSVNSKEGLSQAVIREVKEETGIEIVPHKIICIDDLYSRKYRMVKVWFLSEVTGGQLERTQGAIAEKIIEAKWYSKEELRDEVVYPSVILEYDWELFYKDSWQVKYSEISYADF